MLELHCVVQSVNFQRNGQPLSLDADHIKYEIWYNETSLEYKWYANAGADSLGRFADAKSAARTYSIKDTSLMLLAQRAVDEAVMAWQSERFGRDPDAVRYNLGLKAYPRLEDLVGVIQGFVPLSIFLATSIPPLLTLVRVVKEKELHIAGAMRTTGLAEGPYWVAQWLRAIATSLLAAGLVHVAGYAFGLSVFLHTDPSLLYALLHTAHADDEWKDEA